jgi:hypothetical protein
VLALFFEPTGDFEFLGLAARAVDTFIVQECDKLLVELRPSQAAGLRARLIYAIRAHPARQSKGILSFSRRPGDGERDGDLDMSMTWVCLHVLCVKLACPKMCSNHQSSSKGLRRPSPHTRVPTPVLFNSRPPSSPFYGLRTTSISKKRGVKFFPYALLNRPGTTFAGGLRIDKASAMRLRC